MITDEEQIDSQYITELFLNHKLISQSNCITGIQKKLYNSEGALTYCYYLSYLQENKDLPRALFAKFDKVRATTHYKNLTRNEIDFYKYIGPGCKDFIVGMYDGTYNDQFSCLLLQDFSETHFVPNFEEELMYYSIAARKIAEFHHNCSKNKLAYTKSSKYNPTKYNTVNIQFIKENNQEFCKLLSENLSTDETTILAQVIDDIESRLDDINNYLQSFQNTIVHGDFHLKNCLFYKNDVENDMRILDWQWWDYGIGTYDIAHLLNLYLPSKLKNQELTILKTYYSQLKDLGSVLTWEECLSQYKLFTMLNLFKPAHYAIHCKLRRKKTFWKEFLSNIITSYKRHVINK